MEKIFTLVAILLKNKIPLAGTSIFGLTVKATQGKCYTCNYQGKKYVLTVSRFNGVYEITLATRDEYKKRYFA